MEPVVATKTLQTSKGGGSVLYFHKSSIITPTSYKINVTTYPLDWICIFTQAVISFQTKRERGNVGHVTAVSQPDKKCFQWQADSSRALRSIKT